MKTYYLPEELSDFAKEWNKAIDRALENERKYQVRKKSWDLGNIRIINVEKVEIEGEDDSLDRIDFEADKEYDRLRDLDIL